MSTSQIFFSVTLFLPNTWLKQSEVNNDIATIINIKITLFILNLYLMIQLFQLLAKIK